MMSCGNLHTDRFLWILELERHDDVKIRWEINTRTKIKKWIGGGRKVGVERFSEAGRCGEMNVGYTD